MANYYTYGAIPDAEETVYGPLSQGYAEGGEVDEAVPADRGLPEEPYYEDNPQPNYNLFVGGADVPVSSGFNMGALDQLFANLRKTEELQKMALEPGLLQQGFTGVTGAPSAPMGTGIRVPQAAPSGPAIDFEVTPEMAGALQEVARPAEITAAERAAVQENPRVQALSRISGLLEADDFRGAFDAALKAEQDLGGDFIGNLVDPNKMKMLRGPMDAQEITKFYNEMPQKVFEERYVGPGNEFKKEQAIERNIAALGGEAGYADPTLGVKKEETLLGKLPIKELAALAAAAMGATAIPGLFGAGSAGGAGAGAGAAGAGGAGAAGAGAAGAGAAGLTGVVPTGLVAGTTAANLALPVFTVTAGGGLTAAQIAALAAAGGAGAGALAGSGGASTGSAASTPTAPEAPLEEVVVQATRPPVIPPAVAAPVVGALSTIAPEPPVPEAPIEEVTIEAKRPVEPEISVPPPIVEPPVVEPTVPEGPLEEVTVEAKRPVEPEISAPPPIIEPPVVEPAVPEGPLEEVTIETKRPVEPDVVVPPVVTPPTSPIDTAFPEGPIEEVVVETERPVETDVVVPPVVVPPAPPVEPPFPEGPIEEVVVETERPPVDDELIIPPVVVPPTTPVDPVKEPKINKPDPLKDLKDKYLNLENILKLIGAIGSATAKTPKAPTAPSVGTGGMGGALPKYTYTRQQLSPDIDYYTYGTRPEAKFFEGSFQLERPTQPELPPAKTPDQESPVVPLATPTYVGPAPLSVEATVAEEDPAYWEEFHKRREAEDAAHSRAIEMNQEAMRMLEEMRKKQEPGMATGGLTGYAKGGSKSSRYVDGPGSGREDKIPALLSDGEYVIDAETLALLGDGSTKEGARRMDKFRANIRKHKGRALSRGRISPNAKSPDKYMGGGLT
jgi:hypothetical protein